MKLSHLMMLSLALAVSTAFAQKKPIDVVNCNNWEHLEEINGKSCLLSSDGSYALFKKKSEPQGATTVLKNIKSGAEKKFYGTGEELTFDNESRFAFKSGRDSLVIFDANKNIYSYIAGVKRYFVIPSDKGDKLGCLTELNGNSSLKLYDRNGVQIKELPNVEAYWLSKNGKGLVTKGTKGLTYTNLDTFKQNPLTTDVNIQDAVFSESGYEVAFISKKGETPQLRYANVRTGVSKVLLDSSSNFLKDNFHLQAYGLSFENSNVFFKVSPIVETDKPAKSVITRDVNVWSYHDLYVQDRQMSESKQQKLYTSIINVKTGIPVQLESDTLKLALVGNSSKYMVLTTPINENEFYWNKEKRRMYLFLAMTGEKRLIKESYFPGFEFISISPDNRFLVWFDGKDGNYYSYHLESKKTKNISGFTGNSLRDINQRAESAAIIFNGFPYSGQYWKNDNKALIVYSKNDIWQLDPSGMEQPINLTNDYGDQYDIRFRAVEQENSLVQINDTEFMAWGFDNHTKQNGFWKIGLDKSVNPVKLVMSDEAYYFIPTAPNVPSNIAEDPTAFKPVKAVGKNMFVVRKMNSSSPPNLFATSDFKNFKQLSDIKGDVQYIQVKSKLIFYTLPDGQKVEGILHLPENLDTARKYPLIFNYYERRSEGLNIHRAPALSGHNINIRWYVSRDYLVFEPDFYYKRGETAKSVIDAAKSAVRELIKLPYVDTARMGAQGQSFGGYESNVLAIQTNLFKAVCAMAGPTNIISEYGSLRPGGYNNQNSADRGQRNLGVFPWEHPEVFIKNSPNFHIGKVTTPLLLVHNKDDGAIQFSQAMEVYLGMRRLGKKVWLLEYDKEGHDIVETPNKLDFTIRMQQFFDHYLKDAPAPKWMTRGVPAKMKGIDSGLELDTEIKTPGEGIARPVAPGKIF